MNTTYIRRTNLKGYKWKSENVDEMSMLDMKFCIKAHICKYR